MRFKRFTSIVVLTLHLLSLFQPLVLFLPITPVSAAETADSATASSTPPSPSPSPEPDPYQDLLTELVSTPSATASASPSATPNPPATPSATPEPTPTASASATPMPSLIPSASPTSTDLNATPTPTPTPHPNPLSTANEPLVAPQSGNISVTPDLSPLTLISNPLDISLTQPFAGDYPISYPFGARAPHDLPLIGVMQSRFGVVAHNGIDWAMPVGTPIFAADTGQVIFAGRGDYGQTIILQHSWGKSYYGHLSQTSVIIGDKLSPGQKLGLSGNTGFTTGPHLHFGIIPLNPNLANGFRGFIDPLPYLSGDTLGINKTSITPIPDSSLFTLPQPDLQAKDTSLTLSFTTPPPAGTSVTLTNDTGEVLNPDDNILGVGAGPLPSTLKVKLPSEKLTKPGNYQVTVTTPEGLQDQAEFTWGLIAINPNQPVFLPGSLATFSLAVLDPVGQTVCDADLVLTITDPSGSKEILSTADGTIQVKEICHSFEPTIEPDYYAELQLGELAGTYQVTLTSLSPSYLSITDSFELNPNPIFELERLASTRIYPANLLPMVIRVIPQTDYQGNVSEAIPPSFAIAPEITGDLAAFLDLSPDTPINSGATSRVVADNHITWQVNWQAGEEYLLHYFFDAPDLSPAFFTLGPLATSSWTEPRSWQIAVDAVTGPNSAGTGANSVDVNTDWTSTSDITSSNNLDANAAGSGAFTTDYLHATNFGFSIPASATIDGIVVEIEKAFTSSGNDTGADNSVLIIKGGTRTGNDKALAGNWTSTDAYYTYGTSSDLWGTTWTATDINSSTFGVALRAAASKAGGPDTNNFYVDHVRITVHYTPAVMSISGTANVTDGTTVAVAFDSTLQSGNTTTVSSGTWTLSGITPPASGANIIVFTDVNNTSSTNRSSAIMTYSGSGNVTGMALNQQTLTIGAAENSSTTIASGLSGDYDYDNDTDIVFSANSSTLALDPGTHLASEEIVILSGDTLTIGTTETLTSHDVEINGTLTATGNAAINVSGSWDNNSVFNKGTSTVTFNGSASETLDNTGASTHEFNTLITSGTVSLGLTTTTNVGANLTVGSGTTVQNNGTLTVTGDIAANGTFTVAANATINGGDLTTGASGSVGYSGTPTLFLNGTGTLGGNSRTLTFYTLDLGSGSGTTTAGTSTFAVDNNLLVSSGQAFSLGGNSITVGSSGVTNSGGISVAGSISQTSSGTTTVKSSSGGSAIIGGTGCTATNCSFYNLSFLPTVASAPTFPLGSASGQTITVAGALTVGNGTNAVNVSANTNNPTINVTGAMTVAANGGAYTSASSSTLTVGGAFTNNGTFSGTGALDFNGDFSNSGSGDFTAPASNQFTIAGSFTNGASATFTHNSGTVTLDGNVPKSLSGTMTGTSAFNDLIFNNASGEWDIQDNLTTDGDFTITSASSITANSQTITVKGGFTGGSSFSAGTSTVSLAGANGTTQTIAGSTTFSTLSVSASATRTIAVTAGTTQTISTNITLSGTSCNALLLIRSTSLDTAFTFANSDATPTVTYADFQDTTVTTNTFSSGAGITDSGGNTGITSDNTCAGGVAGDLSSQHSFQRKTFKDAVNSIHWLAYHDGDEIEFKASDDSGTTWTRETELAYDTNDFSIFDKTISATASAVIAVTNGFDVVVRRGDLAATPAVTWQSAVTALDGNSSSDAYDRPFVSLDSNNYIWVGARYYDGSNYVFKAVKSTEPVQSLWSRMAFEATPSQLSDDQGDSNVYGNIVPLASQDMYATFVSGTAMEGCVWDNSDIAWENSAGTAACSVTSGGGSGEDTYFDSLSTDLVAHWKMNESSWNGTSNEVVDSSGNALHGTRVGNATTTGAGFNRSGTFDGTGDSINFSSPSLLDDLPLSDFSASVWFKWNDATAPAFPIIIGKRNYLGATGWNLESNKAGKTISLNVAYPGGTNASYVTSASTIVDGVWMNVTFAWTASTKSAKFYINGAPASMAVQTPGSGTYTSDASDNFNLADDNSGAEYSGLLDETRVYTRAITAEEAAKIYQLVPDAVNIDDASDFLTQGSADSKLIRTGNGTLYSVLNDDTAVEVWKSSDGLLWEQQDILNVPICNNQCADIAVALRSTGVMDIVFIEFEDSGFTFDLEHVTFDTGTNTYGSQTNLRNPGSGSISQLSSAMDASDKAHIAWSESNIYYYSNNVGGSFKSPITVDSVSIGSSDIAIDIDNKPQITYIDSSVDSVYAKRGNVNDATTFSDLYELEIDVNDIGAQEGVSIAVDTLTGDTWIAYIDDTGEDNSGTNDAVALAKHDYSDGWTTWSTVTSKTDVGYEPSIAIAENSQIYVFYQEDSTDQKIAYDVYDPGAGSWAGESVLHTPGSGVDFRDVKAKLSFEWNNYGANRIDYLFSDGTDVYWDYLYVRRSPTHIDNASDFDDPLSEGRQLVRTSNGDLYTFVNDAGSCEIWQSLNGGNNWTQKDSGNAKTCLSGGELTLAVDSSNILHLLYESSATVLLYSTFNTSTGLYSGTNETVHTSTTSTSSIDMSLDSNDIPHVVLHDNAGITSYFYYDNRVGGAWNGTDIELTTTIAPYGASIVINEDNKPEVAIIRGSLLTACEGNANDAASFTCFDTDSSVLGSALNNSSLGIDTSGNTWVAYVDSDGYLNLAKHLDGSAWTSWETLIETTQVAYEPSIAIDGTSIYVFYEDDQDNIVYDKYSGSSWSGETMLEEHGALQNVKVSWSYINNYDSTGTARVQTNTYYFDNSDDCSGGSSTPCDPQSVWNSDTLAFNGLLTSATTASTGTNSNNYLQGDGTNSPATGGSIVTVKARIHGGGDGANAAEVKADIYYSSENLGTVTSVNNATKNWGVYNTLSSPTGGWSWDKLQSLTTRIYVNSLISSAQASKVEILVESTNSTAKNEIDYVYSDGTDVFYNRVALGGATPGTQDEIDTVVTGTTKTLSAVSDSTNYDVHLVYVDDETTDQISYKRWDNNGASSAWVGSATIVADAASDSDSYPSLSLDTSNSNLYAFWIDTSSSYIYYSSCAISSGCDLASEWAAETAWKNSGTNTALSSNYSGAGLIFAQWYDGNAVLWDDITITGGGNTAPDNPTSLTQKTTGDVTISTGEWVSATSIKFTATATDTDNPDTLYLCVEKDILGTSFSNTEDLCGDGVAYNGTGVTVSVTITSQTDASEYHWQARIKDGAGEYSSWVSYDVNAENARDYGLDTTAPTGGTIYDGTNTGVDSTFSTSSLATLSANWDSFNSDVSGLNKYQYSIGTTQGGTEILGWTDNGTSTSVSAGSLTLQTSTLYYFNVRAVDNAGNTGGTVSSNGQLVSPSLSFSISPASLTFASLNAGNSYTDTKITTLTTSTNAYNGYVIRAFTTDYLRSTNGNHTISDFTGGTYASPAAWGASTGYGYTSSDTSIQGFDKFGSGTLYAPFSQTGPGDIVADHTSTVSGTPITDEEFTITSRVTTSNTQASATYSTTVVYTATAQY